MASEETLAAIITVIDRTAAPLHAINARFAAMSAQSREIGSRLGNLAEESGLKTIASRAGAATRQVGHLGESLFHLAEPLAALGAVGSVAGLGTIVKNTTDYAEKLHFAAIQTGLSEQALAGWHYAAGIANIDVQQLDRGFTYFNRRISEAARGKAPDVEIMLGKLGFTNTPGHLADPLRALRAVTAEAQRLIATGQTALATDMFATFFGERTGARLLPLFGKGQGFIDEMMGAAKAHGLEPSDRTVAAALKFEEAYKGMAGSVLGLTLAIGDQLFPSLISVTGGMSQWMDANRQWLATQIGGAVKSLGETLRGIPWRSVAAGVRAFGADAKWAYDNLGGMKTVLLAIAAVEFGPAILAFTQLGLAIGRTIVLFGTLALTNPLVAALAAAGVLAAEILLFPKYWDNVFKNMADTGKALFGVLEAAWQAVTRHFVADFKWAYGEIKPVIDAIRDSMDWINSHLPSLPEPPASNIRAHNIWAAHQRAAAGGWQAPAGAANAAGGPVLDQIVSSLKAHGASNAFIQGAIASALGEGGVWQNWKPGDHGTSFGPWQLHQGGRLNAYLAGGGRPGDIAAQADYVLETMRRLHPGIDKSTDPGAVVDAMHDQFKDYGASRGNLGLAARLIGGANNDSHHKLEVHLMSGLHPVEARVETLRRGNADLDLNLGQAMAY